MDDDSVDKMLEMVRKLSDEIEKLSCGLADHMANMDREFGQMWGYLLSRKK